MIAVADPIHPNLGNSFVFFLFDQNIAKNVHTVPIDINSKQASVFQARHQVLKAKDISFDILWQAAAEYVFIIDLNDFVSSENVESEGKSIGLLNKIDLKRIVLCRDILNCRHRFCKNMIKKD